MQLQSISITKTKIVSEYQNHELENTGKVLLIQVLQVIQLTGDLKDILTFDYLI